MGQLGLHVCHAAVQLFIFCPEGLQRANLAVCVALPVLKVVDVARQTYDFAQHVVGYRAVQIIKQIFQPVNFQGQACNGLPVVFGHLFHFLQAGLVVGDVIRDFSQPFLDFFFVGGINVIADQVAQGLDFRVYLGGYVSVGRTFCQLPCQGLDLFLQVVHHRDVHEVDDICFNRFKSLVQVFDTFLGGFLCQL